MKGGEEGLPRPPQAGVGEEEKPLGGRRMGELVSPDQPSPPPAPQSLQLQVDWGKERPGSFRALPGPPDPLSLLS